MTSGRLPGPIDREELRRFYESDLAPRLRGLKGDAFTPALFQELVSEVAGFVIPGGSYGPGGSASGVGVQGSGIFGERAEQCESRLGLTGVARPAGLVLAQVRLYNVKEWHDGNRPSRPSMSRAGSVVAINRREETDVFRGLFIAFDLGAAVRGATFVDPLRVGPGIASRDTLERVATGDAAFESAYCAMSSDADEARALLLPSVRAGLLRLREETKRPLHVSIAQGRVSVAIDYGRPLFEADSRALDFDRVAEIADLFGLADRVAAALPIGVALPRADEGAASASAEPAPGRPATSRTRIKRNGASLRIEYTKVLSPVLLGLSALGAPLLAWGWFLAVAALLRASRSDVGPLAVMLPLALGTLFWLYAAQNWWGPVTRVEVDDGGVLRVTRGLLRKTQVLASSVRSLEVRKAVLHADDLPLTPKLRGDELRWLAYELGQVLPAATRPSA